MSSPTPQLKDKLVRAGAGAGKTTGLVEQVESVYKIFSREAGRPPRIVVTTFTRKATQELKERLIRKACDDRNSEFLRFVSDPARLHISTIHGLMSFFLKQVGHLAELDSGFKILSESEGRELARRALRNVMTEDSAHLIWFERFDFARVLKMCREFVRLDLEKGPLSAATLDDLKSQAEAITREWQERLRELSASIFEEVSEEKWTAFAQDLKIFAEKWPELTASERPSKPARRGAVQNALQAWHDRAEGLFKEFDKTFDRPAWEMGRWPETAQLWSEFYIFARVFSEELKTLKQRSGSYEMADLEHLTVQILSVKPFLVDVFSDNWDYWMVDEYQDTSPIQSRCLDMLIGDRPRYVVGDPQQSIYLFRGADVGVFRAAEDKIQKVGGETDELMTNYRSAPELLRAINDFMQSVDPVFKPMVPSPKKKHDPTRVCAVFLRSADLQSEMDGLVSRVAELVNAGATLQSICILGRTHAHLQEAATALRAFGFPTHLHATTGFNDRREVMDAQALWRFLVNPHDTHNLVALIRSPWFYVPDGQITDWMSSRPISLWQHIASEPAVQKLQEAQLSVASIGVVKTFESFLREAGFFDLALVNDPAGRKESNLWKMVAKARALESESTRSLLDLAGPELILDPLEVSEGDAASAQEPNCINLMTIHGAKGLEFEHVIVPRAGKALRAKAAAEITALNGRFFFPTRNEESQKNEPTLLDLIVLEKQREEESHEFNRALYVAATRAKSTLTFTWSVVETGSWAERSSWFSRPVGDHVGDGYTVRVADEWTAPSPYAGSLKSESLERSPFRVDMAPTVKRQSVTGLIGGDQKRPTYEGESALRGLEARATGQRIHRMFESLKYRGEELAVADPATRFVLNLGTPPVRELIRDGFVEWGFQVDTPRGVIEGQIDLWGFHDNRIFVIDYKSGSSSRVQRAFEQLTLYGWALRRFGHRAPMTLAVVYPLAEKVELKDFSEDLFLRWENEFRMT